MGTRAHLGTGDDGSPDEQKVRIVRYPIVRVWKPVALEDRMALFFAPPEYERPPGQEYGNHSPLRLLRREVQACLFGEVTTEADALKRPLGTELRLLTSVILCATGLDLLAKFYAGSAGSGRVRSRFVRFIRRHVRNGPGNELLTRAEANALYAIRCALLHSFGLASATETQLGVFVASPEGKAVSVDGVRYALAVREFYASFVACIESYRAELLTNIDRQNKFQRMYPLYGDLLIVPGPEV